MINHLYTEFLDYFNIYGLNVAYWSKYFKNLCKKNGIEKTRWANTKFVNGLDFLDGNPIYSFLVPEVKKAIRIIQKKPKHDNAYLKVWFKTYEEIPGLANYSVSEMVVSLELSRETREMVKQLFTAWIVENRSVEKMKSLIDNFH